MSQVREGLLVTLTEEGAVAVTFLGTRPTLFSAAPPDSREVTQKIILLQCTEKYFLLCLQVNYEETDKELARLSAVIKQSQTSGGQQPDQRAGPGLRLDVR